MSITRYRRTGGTIYPDPEGKWLHIDDPALTKLLEPYVGGHPEMPLHEYEPTGDGTCAACIRETTRKHDHEWVLGWQKCEPSYRWSESQQWPDDVAMTGCRACRVVWSPEAVR